MKQTTKENIRDSIAIIILVLCWIGVIINAAHSDHSHQTYYSCAGCGDDE